VGEASRSKCFGAFQPSAAVNETRQTRSYGDPVVARKSIQGLFVSKANGVYYESRIHNQAGSIMKATQSIVKDPICAMTVDKGTAPQAERDGKTFYFCGDLCRQKFLSKSSRDEQERSGCFVVDWAVNVDEIPEVGSTSDSDTS
jgi:YHS domain-containing protein